MSDPESVSRRFCPRCGDSMAPPTEPRPGEPRDPDAVLCDACYFQDFSLVDAPDRLEVSVCAGCGAVHRGNRWVDVGAADYTDIAVEETTAALGVHLEAEDVEWLVEPEQIDQNTIRMHALFTGVVRGTPVEEEVTLPVYVARQTCSRCGRIAGDFYAATVQVRATDRTPSKAELDRAVTIARDYVADRQSKNDRNAFITEIDRHDSGLDMKLSAHQMAGAIAHRITDQFGGDVTANETLITEDSDGNEVYRVTFLARLPQYTPGDIIGLRDKSGPVLVTSAHDRLKGTFIETGTRYEAERSEGTEPPARLLGTVADAVPTTVVTVEDEHAVQVLDPETYEAKTIPRPSSVTQDTQEVQVLKSRAGLHVIPPDATANRQGT